MDMDFLFLSFDLLQFLQLFPVVITRTGCAASVKTITAVLLRFSSVLKSSFLVLQFFFLVNLALGVPRFTPEVT